MYRKAISDLIKWKNKADKKPLVLKGARQVGKTFLMKQFGEQHYKNSFYINFDDDFVIKELFANDLSPQKIILGLETYFGQKINPKESLLRI